LKFFIDEDLPRSAVEIFREAGFEAVDIRDTPLRGQKDWQIADYVKAEGYCLVTGDYDFADIRNYPPSQYHGLIVVNAGRDATAESINALAADFVKNVTLMKKVYGSLAIVEPGRVRIRR
jgi:predicted nuclease of predicted toxin-antitoxin system